MSLIPGNTDLPASRSTNELRLLRRLVRYARMSFWRAPSSSGPQAFISKVLGVVNGHFAADLEPEIDQAPYCDRAASLHFGMLKCPALDQFDEPFRKPHGNSTVFAGCWS